MAILTANVGATSQPRLTPYITVEMFKNHRRRGVNVDNLVKNGRPDEQDAALAEIIEAASVWVDNTILYTLAATVDTVVDDRVVPDRYGYLRIHPRFQPVIALTDFWSGPQPNLLTQASDLSVAGIMPDKIVMPVGGALSLASSAGPLQFGSYAGADQPVWCKYTYINGYPITQLTAAVNPNDVVLNVSDCTGIIPGQTWLTLYALQNRFRFLAGAVSAQYGPGTVACPPAPHAVSMTGHEPPMLSALPADAIQAVVLATRAIVKDGGGGSARPASTRATGSKAAETEATAGDDFAEAEEFLHPYLLPVE